jgi:hypothetical protein
VRLSWHTPVPFEDDLWNGFPRRPTHRVAKKALLLMMQSYRAQ